MIMEYNFCRALCDYVSNKLTKDLSIIVTMTLHISYKTLLSATMKTAVHI